jgi:hypothetical protein
MRIAVAGALAQRPGRGGHAWVYLQYLLGFRRLGAQVLFVDRLEPDMCVDLDDRRCPPGRSVQITYLRDVMARFGLADDWAVLVDGAQDSIGMDRSRLASRLADCDLLIDVMGYLGAADLLEAPARRVFLDVDPGFGQMWADQGLHDAYGAHDVYLTVGANLGRPECPIPTAGVDWIATRPPVVLELWPVKPVTGRRITSVVTWRGPFAPMEQSGVRYGLRAHQLRPLAGLPGLTGADLELALDIGPSDRADRDALISQGWRLVDPQNVAGSPWSYQEYIEGSAAELMIPKGMYVVSRSGWFSDRSACYLAAGRPVVAQDTGWEGLYPTGKGLLSFQTVEQAAARVGELIGDYPAHAEAARALAEEHFDSDRVLADLLAVVGVD